MMRVHVMLSAGSRCGAVGRWLMANGVVRRWAGGLGCIWCAGLRRWPPFTTEQAWGRGERPPHLQLPSAGRLLQLLAPGTPLLPRLVLQSQALMRPLEGRPMEHYHKVQRAIDDAAADVQALLPRLWTRKGEARAEGTEGAAARRPRPDEGCGAAAAAAAASALSVWPHPRVQPTGATALFAVAPRCGALLGDDLLQLHCLQQSCFNSVAPQERSAATPSCRCSPDFARTCAQGIGWGGGGRDASEGGKCRPQWHLSQ